MNKGASRGAGDWPWTFFELTGAIMLSLGPDGRVRYINPRGVETLGRPLSDILDKDWIEHFVPERARDDVRRVFRQHVVGAANAPERFENPVLRSDGTERIISWRNATIRDASGRVVVGLSSGEDVTEQRASEAALRESEARFRATFEQAAVGMAHVGLDGRFLRLNRKLCEMTGYSHEELQRLTFADITHPDDLDADLAQAAALREGRIPFYTMEKRYIRKDGSPVWVNLTGSLVRNQQGRPDYFIAVVEDISRRKEAEVLSSDEELQRLALSAADAGVWKWEADTGRQIWSPRNYDIFGIKETDEPPDFQKWLARCIHPEDRGKFVEALRRTTASGGGEFRIEARTMHPERGLRWIASLGRVICAADDTPLNAYGICIDITEERRLLEAARETEARLQMAMAASGIGVWDWDLVSGDVTWSENLRKLLGDNEGGPPAKMDMQRMYVHPDDRPRLMRAVREALAGSAGYSMEFRVVPASGEIRWITSRAIVIRDKEGRPLRMTGIDMDVTERKRAEERQARVMNELDHRVKNVLSLVEGIASQALAPGRERDDFIGRIRALAKAHGLLVSASGLDLAALVAIELDPFPKTRIAVDGPPVALSPEGARSLALVLHELVTNAVKHGCLSNDTGTLRIEWSTASDPEPELHLRWTERGGPPVAPPKRTGFGSKVLLGIVSFELRGRVDLDHAPEGLRVEMRIPLGSLRGPAGT